GESYDLLFIADQPGLFPFHDHFEVANTNDGKWLGGMHTMVATGAEHETHLEPPRAVGGQSPSPDSQTVFVRDNYFVPPQLTVPIGSKVRWVHEGQVEHTITSMLGLFDSVLEPGGTFEQTFATAGRYDYFCRLHIT